MRYWIVIEWNQASGQPTVMFNGELSWREEDAKDCAEQPREETRKSGRREDHSVHLVELERP